MRLEAINRSPLLLARGCLVHSVQLLDSGKTLKLQLTGGSTPKIFHAHTSEWDDRKMPVVEGSRIDIVFHAAIANSKDSSDLELRLVDLRPTNYRFKIANV